MQQVHEKQRDQIELWLTMVAELAEHIAEKPEDEITKRDIVKVGRKVQDIVNVLHGKSKLSGWRLRDQ